MGERVLLFGNGLNRTVETNEEIDWGSLLVKLREKNLGEKGNKKDNKIAFPMEFERILNVCCKNEEYITPKDKVIKDKKKILKELKKSITEITIGLTKNIAEKQLGETIHSEFVNLNYRRYLTTNYDSVIEEILKKKFNIENIEENGERSKYSLLRYNKIGDFIIHHIHGYQEKPHSLLLGYEHYCGSLERIRTQIKGFIKKRLKKGIYEILPNDKLYNWAIHFFIDDIDIVGLGLDSSEIDLWWLITYRAFQKNCLEGGKELIKNKIRYFECVSEEDSKLSESNGEYSKKWWYPKKELMESLDIEYFRIPTIEKTVIKDGKEEVELDFIDGYKKTIKHLIKSR